MGARSRWLWSGGLLAILAAFGLTACQTPYLIESAVSQADLLLSRVSIEKALQDERLSEEHKRKLKLAQEARLFAETALGLKKTKNYTSYVHLDRPYVTYVISAAPRTELKPYLWKYPLVGALPYRGYFKEARAKEEAEKLKTKDLDVYVRGVSAFSTLGWFRDPILSSMLRYQDHDLVNTIIHETVHATLYVKSKADFNERLATFIGNVGTMMFYQSREGEASATVDRIRRENADDQTFSTFISNEIDELTKWYEERKGQSIPEDLRQARIAEIRARYEERIRPQISEGDYRGFTQGELNNARLLNYRLYFEDLSDFEAVYRKLGSDLKSFLAFCKTLEDADEPEKVLAAEAAAAPATK
ncbi:MAG: aminopeptidase [Bdellovibrionaceae bacterium]|nr:aminopeptidase [Pseudobdellovibrionaceae bacterium]